MPNFNDAEITAIYVSHAASAGVEDDAPNAPTSGDPFDVTLEMVAGNALYTGKYTLTVSCADLTAWKPAPASMIPTTSPFLSSSTFGGPGWKPVGAGPLYYTFENSETVNKTKPFGGDDHVYQYTVSLVNASGQVVSVKRSDEFVLV
jgi:hypothetical protein